MSRRRTKLAIATITPALLTGTIALAATSGSTSGAASGATNQSAANGANGAVAAGRHGGRHRAGGPLGALRNPLRSRLLSADVKIYVKGQTHEFQLYRGTVQSVSASSLTLKELDGTTVSIPVDAQTKVRNMGKKASLSDIHSGEIAFALRPVNAAARQVRAFQPPPGLAH